jgi:diguanylate cyclase (GGDEF)-like protein/PAS domain S-box-containing protein
MGWIHTLKFRIVTLAFATGVLSAVGTAQVLLRTTQQDIESLLLASGASDRQTTAALLASKLEILQATLTAMTRSVDPALWDDTPALERHLSQRTATNTLFDSIFASSIDGQTKVRLVDGKPSTDLPKIIDRPYFKQAIESDQMVVSEPVVGRASNIPIVILASAAPQRNGKPTGVIGGSLALDSAGLFYNIGLGDLRDGSRSLVMSRTGVILAHPDPNRVMGKASEEPGLSEVYARWRDSGSPIDTDGQAVLSSGYLISMAGIAVSDWMLVRLTPQSIALQPLRSAQRAAWMSAAGVGLFAALLAIAFGLHVTRPIGWLRDRAMASLSDTPDNLAPWPDKWGGEVGELARVFQHVEDERERRQSETRALLLQLEAVLNHAEIGIALSRNSIFELVSRRFCETLGMEKRDMEGKPTRIIYPSDEAYRALADRARPQFLEQGFFAGEVELIRKSGETFWAHMRGRAVVAGDMSKGTIWTFEDVTAARDQREKLTWSSSHDALTGLFNRPAFEAVLKMATAHAGTEPFCALFLDLDRFKHVNDTAGHAAGDAVLREVAKAIQAQVRKADTVARLGGDEFAVVLSNCPLQHARLIAEKIRAAVLAYQLDWEGQCFSVGASIGMVLVDASFATAEAVLAAADNACYAAKHRGRNCVMVYGD